MSVKSDGASSHDTMTGCAVRFFWMLVGNVALFYLAIVVAQYEPLRLSWRDVAFGATILALVAARFVDIAYLGGKTSEGTPATRVDLRRYVFRVLSAGSGVWVLARVLAATGWLG